MAALWFECAWLADGWARRVRVEITHGKIAAVTPDTDPEPGDERHALGLPGLANVHSHGFQRGMAGLTEVGGRSGDSFWSWR